MNAHADMFIVVGHNERNIPRGIYRSLDLGYEIFRISQYQKQALINAFYYVCYPSPLMCRHPQRRFTGAKVHNYFGLCKYLFVYVKKKLYFCTKIATEKQNDRTRSIEDIFWL